MEKMLRDASQGLARRFQIKKIFVFQDYDNDEDTELQG